MNKHLLKTIRDNMPESLKYLSASLFRNKLIKNEEFSKYYKLLEDREKLSPDRINEYQLSQLKQILTYSYQNVPYYKDLFNKVSFNPFKFSDFEQIKNIPFLTREIIKDNFNELKSTKGVKNGYYLGLTGGSTGLPLKFYLDFNSIYKENAFIYFYRKKLGYKFSDKLITFRAIEYANKQWKFNPMYNEMLFCPLKLSKLTIANYARRMNEFKPDYLNGYLSTIWYFAKLLEEYKINFTFKIKGIFLISENIDDNQRKFIEEFFKAKSATFYGHSERCVIAEEITWNRYKFDPYYGYTEQIHIAENEYSIVGTGFLNYLMPFIRYKTDDTCFPENQNYLIGGKRSSTNGFYGHNDEFLSTMTLLNLEKAIFKNIPRYQFIQNEKGKADLLVVVNKSFQNSELELIKKEVDRQTKGVLDIEIKIVENLILTPRGKYQKYICNVVRE
jgi:phenylacetate-CoA ligase